MISPSFHRPGRYEKSRPAHCGSDVDGGVSVVGLGKLERAVDGCQTTVQRGPNLLPIRGELPALAKSSVHEATHRQNPHLSATIVARARRDFNSEPPAAPTSEMFSDTASLNCGAENCQDLRRMGTLNRMPQQTKLTTNPDTWIRAYAHSRRLSRQRTYSWEQTRTRAELAVSAT